MGRIVEPLEKMGARVVPENGKPPLRIEGRQPLTAIRYELPVASAQVKSCVLLAGLNAQGPDRGNRAKWVYYARSHGANAEMVWRACRNW